MKCIACENGDHLNCNLATWCDCECDGPYGDPRDYDDPNQAIIDDADREMIGDDAFFFDGDIGNK